MYRLFFMPTLPYPYSLFLLFLFVSFSLAYLTIYKKLLPLFHCNTLS